VLLSSVGESAGGNGIFVAAIAVDVGVVGSELIEGGGAVGIEDDGVGGCVVGVATSDCG
jgi:hypothetical protein